MSAEAAEHYFFFGWLLAGFAGVLAVFCFVVVRRKLALGSWLPAAATVIESEAVWGSEGTGRKWLARFRYRYEVGGRAYTGRRIEFFRRCTGERARELVSRHPAGSEVQIFYDPTRPPESVMNRELHGIWWLPFFAFVFGVLAFVFFKLPAVLGR